MTAYKQYTHTYWDRRPITRSHFGSGSKRIHLYFTSSQRPSRQLPSHLLLADPPIRRVERRRSPSRAESTAPSHFRCTFSLKLNLYEYNSKEMTSHLNYAFV